MGIDLDNTNCLYCESSEKLMAYDNNILVYEKCNGYTPYKYHN